MSKCFLTLIVPTHLSLMRLWFWAGFPPTSLLFGLLLPSTIKQNKKNPQKPLYTNVWGSDWILLPPLLFGISEHSKRQRCTEKLRKLHICISAVLSTIAVTWMDLSLTGPIYPYATCQSPWKTTFTNKKTHSKRAITRHCAKNRKKSSISM